MNESDPRGVEPVEPADTDTAEGDDRGTFGFGRRAHGSAPGSHYTFGEIEERPAKSDSVLKLLR